MNWQWCQICGDYHDAGSLCNPFGLRRDTPDRVTNLPEGPAEPPVDIVRNNLMTRRGYSPYCGSDTCTRGEPRTTFDGEQFFCLCGWRSTFPPEFIRQYVDHWKSVDRSESGAET